MFRQIMFACATPNVHDWRSDLNSKRIDNQYAFSIDIVIVQFILLCYNAFSLKRFRKRFRLTIIHNLKPTLMLPFTDVWTERASK